MNCLPATMTDTINTLLNMQMGNPQSEITFDTAYGSMTMYTDRVHQNDYVMRVTLMTPFRPLAFALATLDLPCTRADKVEAIWEGLNAIEYPTTDANGERLTPPADEFTCANCHELIDDDNGGCDCDRANTVTQEELRDHLEDALALDAGSLRGQGDRVEFAVNGVEVCATYGFTEGGTGDRAVYAVALHCEGQRIETEIPLDSLDDLPTDLAKELFWYFPTRFPHTGAEPTTEAID